MSTAIRFENVGKQYRLGEVGTGTLSRDLERFWARFRGKPDPLAKLGSINKRESSGGEYVWALKDLSFDVEQGCVLGIVGRNGAGKSTLLKLLSRVTAPTRGVIKAQGTISSLLEVGTGFHPELTGRENVFLNGAILGMRRQEIARRLEEIVQFSGCSKYIDTPVKRYSSGMIVRLGFSVAAHLDCQVLVIDEVLAVGDAEFQQKCLGKMQDIGDSGKTILFVSHNLAAVQKLCNRAILIEQGSLSNSGAPHDIIRDYLKLNSGDEPATQVVFDNSNSPVRLSRLTLQNERGDGSRLFNADQNIQVKMNVEIADDSACIGLQLYMRVHNQDGVLVFESASWDMPGVRFLPGSNEVLATIPKLLLNTGEYTLSIDGQIPHVKYLFQHESAISFQLTSINAVGGTMSASRKGIVRPRIQWGHRSGRRQDQ